MLQCNVSRFSLKHLAQAAHQPALAKRMFRALASCSQSGQSGPDLPGERRGNDLISLSGNADFMPEAPSLLSLSAAGIYVFVVGMCAATCLAARSRRQQRWHAQAWLFAALFFAALIAARLLNLEDVVRGDLRDWLRAEGALAERRVWQGYAIAIAISFLAAAGMYALYWVSQRISGRRNIAVALALASCGAMAVLVALRVISLHAMDSLLFGPLKLNWFADLGITAVVFGCAAYYTARVRSRS